MDLEEMKKLKRKTEAQITELLKEFEDKTCLSVEHVEISTVHHFHRPSGIVYTTLRVSL